jgi:hypothetical protein
MSGEETNLTVAAIPLVPAPVGPGRLPSPVLFDVDDARRLPALVADLRRLGADTIRFRWIPGETRRAFLLAEPPPFHVVLRGEPRVYYEQAPRVWIQLGWHCPRAETIEVPAGQVALLCAPGGREFVPDGTFQSGPDAFSLPGGHKAEDVDLALSLPVSARLVADGASDTPTLWVIRGQPQDQLMALAEETDDRELARLSVALVAQNNERIAVLRARRRPPPILVLDALACRPVLRLPNLFVPVGTRLRPPLRRDAIRALLASDAETIIWLEPTSGGSFTLHRVPEAAFRPLGELITYEPGPEEKELETVAGEPPFALPAFVAHERPQVENRSRPATTRRPAPAPEPAPPSNPGYLARVVRWFAPRHSRPPHALTDSPPADEPPRSLDPRAGRRRQLEERLWAGVRSPESAPPVPWPELARLYTADDRPTDAAACWLNALWEADEATPRWWQAWQEAETGTEPEADLGRRLGSPPTPAAVRAIAAAVAGPSPPDLPLDRARRTIEEHEDWLPARAAWLAQIGLSRLAGGDAVGLARARDRLLARFYAHGLSPDLDLPSVLRYFDGGPARADEVRRWLSSGRESVRRWLVADKAPAVVPTRAYADLILAWGLGRLGDRAASQTLLAEARSVLDPIDEAHRFLLGAFAARIDQALDGRPGGPLPADLLARLETIRASERTDRSARERLLLVKVQYLLQASRILEPTERIDAFREGWLDPQAVSVHPLTGLRSVSDAAQLAARLLPAVASAGDDPVTLATALDLAPRLGETLATGILDRLLTAVETWTFAGPLDRVGAEVAALERGLFVAAHFDRAAAVSRLSESLNRLLEGGTSLPAEDVISNVTGQGLAVMRRLGLRREADRLVAQLAGRLMRPAEARPPDLRRMLGLAGGWFYLGRDEPAMEVLDEARRQLFSTRLATAQERRNRAELACAYAAALGHAPPRLALQRVSEIFQRLQGIGDDLVTNSHFSLGHLRLLETAVRAIVTEDFRLAPTVRRWLDDDEYRVRRRIHKDTRALIGVQ